MGWWLLRLSAKILTLLRLCLSVVSLVFRGQDLLKITNIYPLQDARFSPWKKLGFARERGKWSLGLCQHLKDA